MHETLTWEPGVRHDSPAGLELILPVLNGEHEVRPMLARAIGCLLRTRVPATIAVVDGGSSDRTLEAVDEIAAESLVPIRTVGCSRPGWAAAALRGIHTGAARWVVFAHPDGLGPDTPVLLDHAVRRLAGGVHVVCLAAGGRRTTVLDAPTAELLVTEQQPDGPDFVPHLPDTVRHAGLRIAAHGRAAPPAGLDVAHTVVLERVSV